MRRSNVLWGALAVIACNDAKTVEPQMPSSTPAPAAAAEPEPLDETPMSPPDDTEPQTHVLGIADAEFFDGGTSKAMAVARKELRRAKTPALKIDAPFEVDTATRTTLPVLGVFARSEGDGGELEHGAIVIGVEMSGAGFHAAPALRSGKLGGKGGGKAGGKAGAGADADPAFVASSFDLDVFERLPALPRTGATHKLYVVQGGLLSNGVVSRLSGETSAAPAVVPPILRANSAGGAAAVEAPASRGVILEAPTSGVSEPGGSVVLRGAVRASGASARVFLVATSDVVAGPFSFAVDVPLTDGVGSFSVDLIAEEGPPKRPAQWHWYAFSGEDSAGPASVRLDSGKPW